LLILKDQINYFSPQLVIFVGDLFHSTANNEHENFIKWRNGFPNVNMHLVKGNHDILKADDYNQMNLIVHNAYFSINDFCFIHDLADKKNDESKFVFSGHLHPGIRIKGTGKQSLRFPCFYFNNSFGVLPAFGNFTGLSILEPKPDDIIFAIVNQKVIQVHGDYSVQC
jgi:DNA ligase-associated metallophosphoesterase